MFTKVKTMTILLLLLALNDYHILEPRTDKEVRLEIGNYGTEWDIDGRNYRGYNC